ncbi:MAG: S4 domain-containing protein [Chlorobi bacterium]|nr:S4 domain-containing protein [Chlorobiota bacterium]
MPENGHEQPEERSAYRPPRRRIVRSVLSVNPNEPPVPPADDQRRFFPPEPRQQWRRSPWDYRQPPAAGYEEEYRDRRRSHYQRHDRPFRRDRGFEPRQRGRFRRRTPFIEPADRNRLTPRPTTVVRALVRLLYCSRKLAKQAIKDHVVTVNDRIVREPTYTVRLLYDTVRVDGLLLHHTPRNIYIVLNKPRHYAGAREPNSRHVFNFLMKKRDWFIPLGPLPKSVGGLVVVTNDAEQRVPGKSLFDLMEKEYHVKVNKAPAKRTLSKVLAELQALGTADESAAQVELMRKTKRYAWLSIVTVSASARDLYRILKNAGIEVIAMDRYRIGMITLDGISPGSWRRLSQVELTKIFPQSVPASTIEPLVEDTTWQALYQRWYKST